MLWLPRTDPQPPPVHAHMCPHNFFTQLQIASVRINHTVGPAVSFLLPLFPISLFILFSFPLFCVFSLSLPLPFFHSFIQPTLLECCRHLLPGASRKDQITSIHHPPHRHTDTQEFPGKRSRMRKRAFPISSHFSPTSKSAMPLNYPCLSSCLTTASFRALANTSLPPRPGTRILEANLLFHLTGPWDASPGCLPEPPGQPQAPVKSLEIKDRQNRADFGRAVSPAALRPAHSRCPQQLLETPMTSLY